MREEEVRTLLSVSDDEQFEQLSHLVLSDSVGAEDIAHRLLDAAEPQVRALAADMLGQVSNVRPDRAGAVADHLRRRLRDEPEAEVRAAILVSLGHARQPESLAEIIGYARSSDIRVRRGVAWALAAFRDDGEALEPLCRLSGDTDAEVRDWSTFALAESGLISSSVTDALFARLSDPVGDVRAEAIIGLVRRRDTRVLAALASELQRADVGELVLEADRIAREDWQPSTE